MVHSIPKSSAEIQDDRAGRTLRNHRSLLSSFTEKETKSLEILVGLSKISLKTRT